MKILGLIFRIALWSVLLYAVYQEAGIFTAVAFGFVGLHLFLLTKVVRIVTDGLRKLVEPEKGI